MARKQLVGTVVSDRMMKTLVVRVTRVVSHPKYKRVIRRFQKYKVHDPNSEAHAGDEVRIEETRPLSKDKRWRLVEIVNRGVKKEAVEAAR
ncbi:MAG: 30S ribosomal protein S17 [Candidatus Omnitrophica bacterium]|nr:30S ribosomal protein S17 [Candidatus Omnitrophota bacterium]